MTQSKTYREETPSRTYYLQGQDRKIITPVQSNSQRRAGELQPVKHSALAPTRPVHRAPDLDFFFPVHPPSCCSHCHTLTSTLFFLSRNKGMWESIKMCFYLQHHIVPRWKGLAQWEPTCVCESGCRSVSPVCVSFGFVLQTGSLPPPTHRLARRTAGPIPSCVIAASN